MPVTTTPVDLDPDPLSFLASASSDPHGPSRSLARVSDSTTSPEVPGVTELAELVERSLSPPAAETFTDRTERQAAEIRAAMSAGEFDNEALSVGLEMELYAVDRGGEGSPRLARIPDTVFETGATKELGLHNAEINTEPTEFTAEGLDRQATNIASALERASEAAGEAGLELVLDAMWTCPPPEGSESYLGAVETDGDVVVATNMRKDPRYVALDNQALRLAGGDIELSVPGYEGAFPTILFESLATSIQPHLQIPDTESIPRYYNTAIRTLGPVLALSTNSPFLPADMYDVADPEALVDRTHHELRIAAFEQSVNQSANDKVRVPDDIEHVTDVPEQVLADDAYAPFLREWTTDDDRETFADRHWEYGYKRASYWRWLRCVVGGDPVPGACDERSVRIEYRPIPTQPTVEDVVGLQLLTVGLVHGLVLADHPLPALEWDDARRAFYAAAAEGPEADLHWVRADGEYTTDSETIFEELFAYARRGLADAGLAASTVDSYLEPIECRWRNETTPSTWQKHRVRERLAAGDTLADALLETKREYISRSRETDSFAEWL